MFQRIIVILSLSNDIYITNHLYCQLPFPARPVGGHQNRSRFIWCNKPLGVCRSLQQLKTPAAASAATELQHQLPASKIRGPKLLGNVPFLPSTFYILPGYITPSGQEVNVPGKKNRRNPTFLFRSMPGNWRARPVEKLRMGVSLYLGF